MRIRVTRNLLASAAATAAAVLTVADGGSTASAQVARPGLITSCYSNPSSATCNNRDPYDTGCAADAYVASSAWVYVNGSPTDSTYGYVQNWYSPHCGTNWSEFVPPGNYGGYGTVYVCVDSKDLCTARYTADASSTMWSDQLYSPTTVATAYAQYVSKWEDWNAGGSASA